LIEFRIARSKHEASYSRIRMANLTMIAIDRRTPNTRRRDSFPCKVYPRIVDASHSNVELASLTQNGTFHCCRDAIFISRYYFYHFYRYVYESLRAATTLVRHF